MEVRGKLLAPVASSSHPAQNPSVHWIKQEAMLAKSPVPAGNLPPIIQQVASHFADWLIQAWVTSVSARTSTSSLITGVEKAQVKFAGHSSREV
jgi:hypothetical protein